MTTTTPDIILGPPGTGKTTTLIARVEGALRRGVRPDRIGFFSFTRKAASEAIERACQKFKLSREDFPNFSTLHSMCYRQLGIRRGEVFEGAKLQEFARFAGVRITGRWADDGSMVGFDVGDRCLFMENLARIRGVELRDVYDEDHDDLPWQTVEYVAKALREFKRANGYVDFTDMLSQFVNSGVRLNLEELNIDESQDLSHLQWLVVRKLMDGCKRVGIAGDDDQAIYRWAGADVDQLIDMEGNVEVLNQSYRVPPVVQKLAHAIIEPVLHRRQKRWRARTGEDGRIDTEMSFRNVDVGSDQTLVLARNEYVLRQQVEPVLRAQGIVYEKYGHSSLNVKMMGVIQDWEALRQGKVITGAQARRIYEFMRVEAGSVKRGHKKLPGLGDDEKVGMAELMESHGLQTSDPWFRALHLPKQDMDYIRAARRRGEKLNERPRVVLSTIHGAKGGQAEHVVVMKEIAARSWRELEKNPDDERRVWYVAVTRTLRRLTIVDAQTRRRCPWL